MEDLTETEIRVLHEHYQRLVAMAKHDVSLTDSHSVEEAEERHRTKTRPARLAPRQDGATGPTGGPRSNAGPPA